MSNVNFLVCCSFCGHHKGDIAILIVGPEVSICNECVVTCVQAMSEHLVKWKPVKLKK